MRDKGAFSSPLLGDPLKCQLSLELAGFVTPVTQDLMLTSCLFPSLAGGGCLPLLIAVRDEHSNVPAKERENEPPKFPGLADIGFAL